MFCVEKPRRCYGIAYNFHLIQNKISSFSLNHDSLIKLKLKAHIYIFTMYICKN